MTSVCLSWSHFSLVYSLQIFLAEVYRPGSMSVEGWQGSRPALRGRAGDNVTNARSRLTLASRLPQLQSSQGEDGGAAVDLLSR